MSFDPPTGTPVNYRQPSPVSVINSSYMIGDWECHVYLHPTKRTSVRFVAKNTKKPWCGINTDLFASQLATFDPDKFWKDNS